MPFHTHSLPNGLQLVGETIPSARSAAVGFFVKTGSRDETAEVAGVSHFLEHMVFKGTQRRTALDVNLDFDRIGANYNAYTSEENTVYYAAVLPEYLADAVDILADVLRPSLRGEDFDTEKQVILEEIKMYEDAPGSMAWDHARRIYYADHPLGNTILGSTASVGALSRDQMKGYFDRRYVAPNVVAAAAGNLDWPAFVRLVESKCGHWPAMPAGREHVREARGKGGLHILTQPTSSQEHVLVMSPGSSAESPLRYTAATLAIAVGDDSGSRLYWALVDPGLVESASCGTDQGQGCGMTVTSFSCDPDGVAGNLEIVRKILDDVQRDGITAEELAQAKNKITSRVVRHSERPMGRMRSIASSWIYCQEYSDVDRELARFDAVSLETIREYLDRYPINEATVVEYGPLTS
ncbi:MAG TPA: pitrilysin family protein [Fimbriiglobus sp.]|nr:pitrilysin family protein [Fimbriiglobus sp.]